ncbi:MAG: alginate export family protein [Planctomycetota bacterium]
MNRLRVPHTAWLASTLVPLVLFSSSELAAQQSGPPPQSAETEDDAGPYRLNDAWDLPEWLRIGGSVRLRYEGIEGQFRANPRFASSDHVGFIRTNILTEVDVDEVTFGVEVLDSRHVGGGSRSFLSTANVNTVDFLQGYVDVTLDDEGRHEIRAGRQTLDLGSRRLVARNRFRNTINSFTGVDYNYDDGEGTEAHVFWFLPVRRRPTDFPSILDNDVELDDQDFDQSFFGGHFRTEIDDDTHAEVYGFVLLEDGGGRRERELFTPGARVKKKARTSEFDWEIEGAAQLGDSEATPTSPELRHVAWFGHASAGYTFDCDWKPRVRVAIDAASGDRNPNDGENNRFETLFGARRFEYGPTGIFGLIARSNLVSPEIRIEARPTDDLSAFFAYRVAWLQSESDAAPAGGVRDPSGATGNFLGQQIEARLRYELIPKSVRLEMGAAYVFAGDVLDDAPNARREDIAYAYFQTAWTF